jgi:hypothetical protein
VPSEVAVTATSFDDDIFPPRSKHTPISAPREISLVALEKFTLSTATIGNFN